jgi:hypothetical protein
MDPRTRPSRRKSSRRSRRTILLISGSIVACSSSADPAVRKKRTIAGIKCRRDNIDKYLQVVTILRGRYSEGKPRSCLKGLQDELDGRGEGDGGAGPEHYKKLGACREEARQERLPEVSVDSATTDDALAPKDTDVAQDVDCDAECAGKLIKEFMLGAPEPAQAKADDE